MLGLQCMSLTLDEILEHEERLRREIMERECLLAAFKVLHGYVANGHGPKSLELGSFFLALGPSTPAIALQESTTELPPPPTPVRPYIHPELEAFTGRMRNYGQIVAWAIKRMTDDFSIRDIAALLEREGYPLKSPDISVVITRLKSRGEIEEIKRGRGPIPAVFRKPETATPPTSESDDPMGDAEPTTASVAAA
jgi:hypothetical protein